MSGHHPNDLIAVFDVFEMFESDSVSLNVLHRTQRMIPPLLQFSCHSAEAMAGPEWHWSVLVGKDSAVHGHIALHL